MNFIYNFKDINLESRWMDCNFFTATYRKSFFALSENYKVKNALRPRKSFPKTEEMLA